MDKVSGWLRLGDSERQRLLAGPEAPEWVESLAHYGFAEAQTLLGQMLLDRRPQPARGTAFGWFVAAARANHAPAINMVGRCLEHGWDVTADPVAAVDHYRRAADAGYGWAQFNLGCALLHSIGTERDRPAAFAWFDRAAAQGVSKAMNMLGRFHEEGWDRPPCRRSASGWYRRAAEAGDFRGQFNLASLLHKQGCVDDALAWLRVAIAAGSPDFLAEVSQSLSGNQDPRLRALGLEALDRGQVHYGIAGEPGRPTQA